LGVPLLLPCTRNAFPQSLFPSKRDPACAASEGTDAVLHAATPHVFRFFCHRFDRGEASTTAAFFNTEAPANAERDGASCAAQSEGLVFARRCWTCGRCRPTCQIKILSLRGCLRGGRWSRRPESGTGAPAVPPRPRTPLCMYGGRQRGSVLRGAWSLRQRLMRDRCRRSCGGMISRRGRAKAKIELLEPTVNDLLQRGPVPARVE
jgi:hypothetical protein